MAAQHMQVRFQSPSHLSGSNLPHFSKWHHHPKSKRKLFLISLILIGFSYNPHELSQLYLWNISQMYLLSDPAVWLSKQSCRLQGQKPTWMLGSCSATTNSLLVAWERQQKMAQVPGSCYPCGRPERKLASSWPGPSYCATWKVNQQMKDISLSLSNFQTHK